MSEQTDRGTVCFNKVSIHYNRCMTIFTAWPISGPPVLKLLSALASDVRFELVQILAHGEHRVCDLEAVLNMPQSKVSYHLAAPRAVWSAANSAARTAIIDWNAGDSIPSVVICCRHS